MKTQSDKRLATQSCTSSWNVSGTRCSATTGHAVTKASAASTWYRRVGTQTQSGPAGREDHRRARRGSRRREDHRRAGRGSRRREDHRRAGRGSRRREDHRRAGRGSRRREDHRRAGRGSRRREDHRRAGRGSRRREDPRRAERGSRYTEHQMDRMWLLLLVVACALWWVGWHIRHRRLLALAARLPGPPGLPFLGNALIFNVASEEVLNVFGKLKQKYGRVYKFWLGAELHFCITEPDDIKILLQSSETNWRGPQYKYMEDFLGYGIITGSGPVWRKTRKTITPSYGNKAIETYSHVFNDETGFLLERLRTRPAGESFNIYEELVKSTTYTTCQTLFGLTREQTLELPHLQDVVNETHQMYENVFMRMIKWYLQIKPYYWISQHYRRNKQFIKKMLLVMDAIVKHRAKKLGALLTHDNHIKTDADGDKMGLSSIDKFILTNAKPNYEEMLKQLFGIFTTSQEPTANFLSSILLMMAYHPEYQEKLYAEIKSVFGETDRDVTDEDLKHMPYLDMVFKETIRLFPVASIVQRTVMEDIEISNGSTLPAGSAVMFPIYHIHRDAEFWPEPDAFDPERFAPERCAGRHIGSYIPFGLGALSCIGRHFGTKLVKTICIRVLREFRLSSPESYEDLRILCAVSVEFVNGYPVFLHQRNH